MGSPSPAPSIPLSIEPSLRGAVRLGLVAAAPVAVGPAGAALLDEMDTLAARLARRHAGATPSDIEGLTPARELYRRFGIDPTKTRPSSEALLRRVIKGMSLPRIVNAVDLCNLLALEFLLPIGLYDAERVSGAVELRQGRPGESFEGIRKGSVHLAGRPVLVDELGPFGNPTSDSARTSVGTGTRALWMVIFAPASLAAPEMERHVLGAGEAMRRHLAPAGAAVALDRRVLG